MNEILIAARKLADELAFRNKTEKERLASHYLYQLIEYIKYLQEQDETNESRIEVLKNLNSKYREHVIQLITDTDELKDDLKFMTESNFANLDTERLPK